MTATLAFTAGIASCERLPLDRASSSQRLSTTVNASFSASDSEAWEAPTCLRHGVAADQGRRRSMEDFSIAMNSLSAYCHQPSDPSPSVAALYAVFDGHNGRTAAQFASEHILEHIVSSGSFPHDLPDAMRSAFLQLDSDYFAAINNTGNSAGTTALAAMVWGNRVVVANAGDSRAVLSRRGKAIELTRAHKPHLAEERARIELCGGFVCVEGLLGGELGVARAIGDYHLGGGVKVAPGGAGPLTAEPELTEHLLAPLDEFLLLGCDGLWDVLPSQRAVELARSWLRSHNDPQRCAEQLVAEALRLHTSDNVTVICVCFGDHAPMQRCYGGALHRLRSRRQGMSAAALQQQQLSPDEFVH